MNRPGPARKSAASSDHRSRHLPRTSLRPRRLQPRADRASGTHHRVLPPLGLIDFLGPERMAGLPGALAGPGYPAGAVATILGGNLRRVAEQTWATSSTVERPDRPYRIPLVGSPRLRADAAATYADLHARGPERA